MSDPAKYRTKEEVNRMRQERDPIDNVRDKLEVIGIQESDLKDIDLKIRVEVSDAVDFAQSSPEPDPDELYTDILLQVR